MDLWDYRRGTKNEISDWAKRLSARDRAALHQKLDLLSRLEFDQAIKLSLLAGPISKSKHILKLRVAADRALRPLLCRGPILPLSEYTILVGAEERDWILHPPGVLDKAIVHRERVIRNSKERIAHERPKS